MEEPDQKKKYLWVFGNAVQDVTVGVDLDRLSREEENLRELVRLDDGVTCPRFMYQPP